MTESIRLQKALSAAGVSSRRKAEEMMLQGRVKVNGKVVRELGTRVDPQSDSVMVDGRPIQL
ncbi:MAG: MFS transporter, partial [Actinobacteria bacterium]|nr:MFS transporter [Actinomycetota bacterium]